MPTDDKLTDALWEDAVRETTGPHHARCWRTHPDCAERLLSEAADAIDGLCSMLAEDETWTWDTKDERALLARLRAALEDGDV